MSATSNVLQRLSQYKDLLNGAHSELFKDWQADKETGAQPNTDPRVLACGHIHTAITCIEDAMQELQEA